KGRVIVSPPQEPVSARWWDEKTVKLIISNISRVIRIAHLRLNFISFSCSSVDNCVREWLTRAASRFGLLLTKWTPVSYLLNPQSTEPLPASESVWRPGRRAHDYHGSPGGSPHGSVVILGGISRLAYLRVGSCRC